MSIFLLLANFLAALFAIQLFRGDISPDNPMNFLHVGNAFLAMYQVLTSENWTNILWSTSDSENPFKQQWIAIFFVASWFFFANCEFATSIGIPRLMIPVILLQMFVAVINEVSFTLTEFRGRL
jgi:voltage-dependent calcium channel